MAGLSVFIDGIEEMDDPKRTDVETEIESVIAEALKDHPDVPSGATVRADYHPTPQE